MSLQQLNQHLITERKNSLRFSSINSLAYECHDLTNQIDFNHKFKDSLNLFINNGKRMISLNYNSNVKFCLRKVEKQLIETRERINLLEERRYLILFGIDETFVQNPLKNKPNLKMFSSLNNQYVIFFETNHEKTKMRQVLVFETIHKSDLICVVCQSNVNENCALNKGILKTSCKPVPHLICRHCLLKWMDSCFFSQVNTTCPICRNVFLLK